MTVMRMSGIGLKLVGGTALATLIAVAGSRVYVVREYMIELGVFGILFFAMATVVGAILAVNEGASRAFLWLRVLTMDSHFHLHLRHAAPARHEVSGARKG